MTDDIIIEPTPENKDRQAGAKNVATSLGELVSSLASMGVQHGVGMRTIAEGFLAALAQRLPDDQDDEIAQLLSSAIVNVVSLTEFILIGGEVVLVAKDDHVGQGAINHIHSTGPESEVGLS